MRRIYKVKVTKAEQYIHPSVPRGGGGSYVLTLMCEHTKTLKASVWWKNKTGYVHCDNCATGRIVHV